MSGKRQDRRRVRVGRGIYLQPNGKYAVRVVIDGRDQLADLIAALHAKGLTAKTVVGTLTPLGSILRLAVRRGYIADNPLRRLERSERPQPVRPHWRVLGRDELARLLAGCPRRYRPLLATAAYTGVRLSELLGLNWSDIDFAAGVIHVRCQLSRARIGSPARRVPPKTAAGIREIPLVRQLAVLLRQHKHSSCFADKGDYVFATGRGTPFGHRNVERRALARAVERAGMNTTGEPRLRFHDLRHTFASHLIVDLRLDVAQVSRILGHASTSITLDTYTHLFDQAAHGAEVRAQMGRSEFANLLRPFVDRPTCARRLRRLPANGPSTQRYRPRPTQRLRRPGCSCASRR